VALLRRGREDLDAARRLVADEERRCLERAEDLCNRAEQVLEDVRRYKQMVRAVDFRPLGAELDRAIRLAQRVEADLLALSADQAGGIDLRVETPSPNGRHPSGVTHASQ
jgi:hypothetical protein